jgi:hypothetical protein
MPIPQNEVYDDERSAGLEITFKTPGLALADIGLVCSALDYMLNKATGAIAGIASVEPIWLEEWFIRRRRWAPYFYPILATAEITDLNFESFSAKTRIKLHRLLRDLGIGVTSSLVAAALIHAFAANGGTANRDTRPPERLPDLGPNITGLSQSLSATGKPWELTIKDSQTGVEVTLKGNQSRQERESDDDFPRSGQP